MPRFCNGKYTFSMQLCTVCWLLEWDLTNAWIYWHDLSLDEKPLKAPKIQSGYKRLHGCTVWGAKQSKRWNIPSCTCVLYMWRTSLDNDHNPPSPHHRRPATTLISQKTTQKPLLVIIRPICKLLCSDRPSQQHFNNLNTISIIHRQSEWRRLLTNLWITVMISDRGWGSR